MKEIKKRKVRKENIGKCIAALLLTLAMVAALLSQNEIIVQAAGSSGADVVHYLTPYQWSDYMKPASESDTFTMMGKTFQNGVYSVYHSLYGVSRSVQFDLEENYDSIRFTVGHMDNASTSSATLTVYLDGEESLVVELTGTMKNQTHELTTEGVNQISFSISTTGGMYGIANVIGKGHSYEETIIKTATVDTVGSVLHTCRICGESYTSGIPKVSECNVVLVSYQQSDYMQPASEGSTFSMMGKTFQNGVYSVYHSLYGVNRSAEFALDGLYDSVTFVVGHMNNVSGSSAELTVFIDGEAIADTSLTFSMLNRVYTIDTRGAEQLSFFISTTGGMFGIANVTGHRVGGHIPSEEMNEDGQYLCTECGCVIEDINITPNIANCSVDLEYTTTSYTGNACMPSVTVKDQDIALDAGIDYEVTYNDNVDVGTASVTVAGKGGYTGSIDRNFTITEPVTTQGNVIVKYVDEEGKELADSKSLNGVVGESYTTSAKTIEGYTLKTMPSNAAGNYTKEDITVSYVYTADAVAKNIADCTIDLEYVATTYTGSACTPSVTVKDQGAELKAGTDYEVTYKDNVNVGTASVTISGKGNYTGMGSKTFTIAPADSTPEGTDQDKPADVDPTEQQEPEEQGKSEDGTKICYDTVYFGHYLQEDTNGDGVVDEKDEKQPIRWRVLSQNEDGTDAYVLAEQILDCQLCSEDFNNFLWEKCSLRKWLNNDFYNAAFSDEEKKEILQQELDNSVGEAAYKASGEMFMTSSGGNNTTDNVYLASIEDMCNPVYGFSESYDAEDPTRIGWPTAYAVQQGVWPDDEQGSWWWLRSLGSENVADTIVTWRGCIHYLAGINFYETGVRPVLHLNLTSSFVEKGEPIEISVPSDRTGASDTSTPSTDDNAPAEGRDTVSDGTTDHDSTEDGTTVTGNTTSSDTVALEEKNMSSSTAGGTTAPTKTTGSDTTTVKDATTETSKTAKKDKPTTINIKNKKTYKTSKKVTVKDADGIKTIKLNRKIIKVKNKKTYSFTLSKYKKQLKKKGKWNKLTVTDKNGKKKTIQFKTK